MSDNSNELVFEDKELNRVVRKSRYRSVIKTIVISLIIAVTVFLALNFISLKVTKDFSKKAYEEKLDEVKLSVPAGYISKMVDNYGFFGGTANYTVCRYLGGRNINLEQRFISYGILKPKVNTGGNIWLSISSKALFDPNDKSTSYIADLWPKIQWENGYNMMIFFNPKEKYMDYRNDLKNLEGLPSDRLIEIGVSFDKPYYTDEIHSILGDIPLSWYWIGNKKSDSGGYIIETETVGLSSFTNNLFEPYRDLLERLKKSKDKEYNNLYKDLVVKGYTDLSNVPILGAIVYGTKDELKPLVGNSHIKASSFGVITSRY